VRNRIKRGKFEKKNKKHGGKLIYGGEWAGVREEVPRKKISVIIRQRVDSGWARSDQTKCKLYARNPDLNQGGLGWEFVGGICAGGKVRRVGERVTEVLS